MKIFVQNSQQDFIINIIDPRIQIIEEQIKQIPLSIRTQRRFPYSITDKKTQIKYYVDQIRDGISLSFSKAQIQNYDLNVLIQSLKFKLDRHFDLFSRYIEQQPRPYEKFLKHFQYSPTDIEITFDLGNIAQIQFCISKVIGNSLMAAEETALRIRLIKWELPQKANVEFLKCPPINLHILSYQKSFSQLCQQLQNTFLVGQFINYFLTEYQYYQMAQFIPNEELGTVILKNTLSAYFKPNPLSLQISMSSRFVEKKLIIEIREPLIYNALMGLNQCKIDFNKFVEDLEIQRKVEFTELSQFVSYLSQFFQKSIAYISFYNNKQIIINMIQRFRIELVFQRNILHIFRYLYEFLIQIHSYYKRDPNYWESKKVNFSDLFYLIQDRFLSLYFLRLFDNLPIYVADFIKVYQEKLDSIILKIKSAQITFDECQFVQKKLLYYGVEVNIKENTISIKILLPYLREYKFSDKEIQCFSNNEFAKRIVLRERNIEFENEWHTIKTNLQDELTIK